MKTAHGANMRKGISRDWKTAQRQRRRRKPAPVSRADELALIERHIAERGIERIEPFNPDAAEGALKYVPQPMPGWR